LRLKFQKPRKPDKLLNRSRYRTMKTTQYSACVMRDTPGRQWSETSSRSGDKTELTLSTLVGVDRPYQDALAHGMADVAEDSEWIQKHVLNCGQTMVMKTLTCSLLLNHCLQTCLPIVSVSTRPREEGVITVLSGAAPRLNLPSGYST
jgi:hypothetical protein